MVFKPTRCVAAAFALATVATLGTACGSDSTPATPGPTSTANSAPAGNSTKVTVDETDFKITLSQTTFTAGTYEFAVTNSGNFLHNFTIEGKGLDKKTVPDGGKLAPGDSTSLTVELLPGIYEITCTVDSHKDKGMFLTITVT